MGYIFDYFSTNEIATKFSGKLWIPAFAARVCYFKDSNNPLDVLHDEKVVDQEKARQFLIKLAKQGHTSVFSHIYARFRFEYQEDAMKYALNRFKVKFVKPRECVISFRHVIEDFLRVDRVEDILNSIYVGDVYSYKDLWTDDNVLLLSYNKDYMTFAIGNISRVTTHQLVRHTMLNFSQRSDRYVDNTYNKTIKPPSIAENKLASKIFDITDLILRKGVYKLYRKLGIKKEDARFILPEGNETMIVVSGTFEAFDYFFKLRLHKSAQWEIRNVAKKMYHLATTYTKYAGVFTC